MKESRFFGIMISAIFFIFMGIAFLDMGLNAINKPYHATFTPNDKAKTISLRNATYTKSEQYNGMLAVDFNGANTYTISGADANSKAVRVYTSHVPNINNGNFSAKVTTIVPISEDTSYTIVSNNDNDAKRQVKNINESLKSQTEQDNMLSSLLIGGFIGGFCLMGLVMFLIKKGIIKG